MTRQRGGIRPTDREPNAQTGDVITLSCHDTSAQAKINAVRKAVELGDEHLTVHIDADEPLATTLRHAVLVSGGRISAQSITGGLNPLRAS